MTKAEANKKAKQLKHIVGTLFINKTRGTIYIVLDVTPSNHPPQSDNFHIFIGFSNPHNSTDLVETSDYFFTHYQEHKP